MPEKKSTEQGVGCAVLGIAVLVLVVCGAGVALILWGVSLHDACEPSCKQTPHLPRGGDDQTLVDLLWLGGGVVVLAGLALGGYAAKELFSTLRRKA